MTLDNYIIIYSLNNIYIKLLNIHVYDLFSSKITNSQDNDN